MTQVQIDRRTKSVLAFGEFPTAPLDPTIAVVAIADAEVPKLHALGAKTLGDDGVITVTPPAPLPPAPAPLNEQLAAALSQLPADTPITGSQLAQVIALLRGQ